MKVYISADIEGVAGITHWEETDPSNSRDYKQFQDKMTSEVTAACEGALEAGAREIWVKDAHWGGRNILAERLPRETRLIRGWSRHPYMMVQEIDSSFDAVAFVGYHSKAGSGGNPLAHTLSGRVYAWIRINGETTSEFDLYSRAASLEGVPSVFLSGDEMLCQEVRRADERIVTVATSFARGLSTVSIHPEISCSQIREGMKRALSGGRRDRAAAPRGPFRVEVGYKAAVDAYKNSFYPGARLTGDHTVEFETESFFEVLRLLVFVSSAAT